MRSQNAHDLHSPFVFDLYNSVFTIQNSRESRKLRSFRTIKNLPEVTSYRDPKTKKIKTTKVKKLAKRSASSHQFSYFLKRLIEHLNYSSVLETGTSLGTNALYLTSITGLKITTLEGSKEIAELAKKRFNNYTQIKVVQGNVWNTFPSAIETCKPNLIFLDADHRSVAIDFYLKSINESSPNAECIVIHDIYWSKDMNKAWEKIVQNENYNLTIDLFEAGIVFPNYPMRKQHFTFRL